MSTWQNWGGNVSANPTILRPKNTQEVQALVTNSPSIKAVGASHSFTQIAATDGVMLKLNAMNAVIGHDAPRSRVRVQAGMSLNQLNRELLALGLAMPNLGHRSNPSMCAGLFAACRRTPDEFARGVGKPRPLRRFERPF